MLQVEAWADGSPWKRRFQAKHPSSVYVEVQDYFVKSLAGWTPADGPVGEHTLEAAKRVLDAFDVVLLTEHMRGMNTSAWLEHTFGRHAHAHPSSGSGSGSGGDRRQRGAGAGGMSSLLMERANKVDSSEVQRLEALLAPDKVTQSLTRACCLLSADCCLLSVL